MDIPVEHDAEHHRFVATLPDGSGELVYSDRGNNTVEMEHTGVDPSLRGHGVADALAAAAFAWARANQLNVIITCPFVTTWIKRHPEYADMVVAATS